MDQALTKKNNANEPHIGTTKKRSWFKMLLIFLLLAFIVIQFFQPDKNNNSVLATNDITKVVTVPDSINSLLHTACYDCHSSNTDYPWYSNIQPLGWWLADHIKEGKKELNFNEFGTYSTKRQLRKLEEVKHEVNDGEMPLNSYTIIHQNAKISAAQKQLIATWVDSATNQIKAMPVKE
jgi:hypothetical protein